MIAKEIRMLHVHFSVSSKSLMVMKMAKCEASMGRYFVGIFLPNGYIRTVFSFSFSSSSNIS